jgi:hypothetical protein
MEFAKLLIQVRVNDQHLPCSQGEGMNKQFLFTIYLPYEYK